MLSNERKQEIYNQAVHVNSIAEGYQLIHACFAIQQIINDHINKAYQTKFNELKNQLKEEDDDGDSLERLLQKKRELEKESRKSRINISIRYISALTGCNASTTRVGTYKNTFIISLPAELEHIRNDNGEFDYQKMKTLRKLMAHELGHILLHTDYINEEGIVDEDGNKEEESNYFADTVIELRQARNKKFYSNHSFESI